MKSGATRSLFVWRRIEWLKEAGRKYHRADLAAHEAHCRAARPGIVGHPLFKEGADWYLRIFIDKPDGVTIEDCEAMSRAINSPLDELDPH